MNNCYQYKTMTVLDHGYSVLKYFKDIYNHLKFGSQLYFEWKLPRWIYDYDLNYLTDIEKIEKYIIYHDCGKPFCREVDENGNQHFPNHAYVSYLKWLEVDGDLFIAELMRDDMLLHIGDESFYSNKNAFILLLVGLCEIHANSEMFGGIDSTSFKIKWKRINRAFDKIMIM